MSQQLLRLSIITILLTQGLFNAYSQAFITTWKTDNPGVSEDNQITIPTTGTGYNYTVDWGDGSSDSNVPGNITHTYATSGTYTVSITGDFPRIHFNDFFSYFGDGGDGKKILTVEQWGNISWSSMQNAFFGCENLNLNASDAPDLSNVSNMDSMFAFCSSLDSDLNNWNVSNVTSMVSMFTFASSFQGGVSGWDVSNVGVTQSMFAHASSFDDDLSNWDVSSVANMNTMFEGAATFTGVGLENWDVSMVFGMSSLFNGASALNADLSSWNVSSVTSMARLFEGASAFNSDLSSWNVSLVTNMYAMFDGATSFNSDLSGWDISAVTNISNMLNNCGLSISNYDATLMGWAALPGVTIGLTLGANGVNYCLGEAARNDLITNSGWTITDGGLDCTTGAYITTWKTDNPGTSADNQITIPTSNFFSYDYFVDWGDGSSDAGVGGDITHTYASPGTYTVKIVGDFPFINFNNNGDKNKILTIEQWGNIEWQTSMVRSYMGCTNLTVPASDVPDLTDVTSLGNAFQQCTSLTNGLANWDVSTIGDMSEMFRDANSYNEDLSNWNVSTVVDMESMFLGARAFNGNISSWDVINVSKMGSMFSGAISFNGNIGNWNVANVEEMQAMFRNATSFNTDISNWNTSKAIFMNSMFEGAIVFNQNLNNWDVSLVSNLFRTFAGASAFNSDLNNWDVSAMDNMNSAFVGASSFNGNISNWDVSGVTDFSAMFSGASEFNQNLGSWNTSAATNMQLMFSGAEAFNQDISSWDVSEVINMQAMLNGASSFNQNLGSWDIGRVSTMNTMFNGTALNTENYDRTLIGWASLSSPPQSVAFSADANHCWGSSARASLIDDHGWSINDNGQNCVQQPFVTTWKTDNPGTSTDNQITIPTEGNGYNYVVDWGDGITTLDETEDATHTYFSPGVYTVTVYGDFPRIYFNDGGDKEKIISINEWGDIQWSSMEGAFKGCANAIIITGQTPDLTQVTSLAEAFYGSGIGSDINNWNVSNVTNMSGAFANTSSFNSDLSNWDVGSVTNMSQMFADAIAFNGNVSTWGVINVENMSGMFAGTFDFDQDISNWNTSQVTNMAEMFEFAEAFNQNISSWDVTNVTDMTDMFTGSSLTPPTYDKILDGWASQVVQSNVVLGASDISYCLGAEDREKLINDFGWDITDGGEDCPDFFITTWKTDNQGTSADNQITIPTTGTGYNYAVDWGDGFFDTEVAGDITHTYNTAGTYTVRIAGDFPRIYFNNSGDRNKILSVDQWGAIEWSSMNSAFAGCNNFDVIAEDVPDLSGVTDLTSMFSSSHSLIGTSLSNWDVSSILEMSNVFSNAQSFTADLSSWDVSNVTTLAGTFFGAIVFESDLSNWNVSSVTSFVNTFGLTNSFNSDISGWDVGNATSFAFMFSQADIFDQNLGSWNISNVVSVREMFDNSGLSAQNYESTLEGWASQTNTPSSLNLGALGLEYCSGNTERTDLINTYGWTISGDIEITCSSETDVTSFVLTEQSGAATLDPTNHTVLIYVFLGTDVTTLSPTIEVSENAIFSPSSAAQDFSSPFIYTVTAQDGTTQDWTMTVLEQEEQTLTFDAIPSRIYGDVPFDLSATASTGFSVDFEVVTGSEYVSLSNDQLTIGGAGEVVVRAIQTGNERFASISSQQSFNIAQAILTVTADDKEIVYGGTLPVVTFSYSGFVGNDDESNLDVVPTGTILFDNDLEAGEYDIVLENGQDNNYSFQYTNGTLTVTKATLQAIAEDKQINEGESLPNFTFTYQGFIGSDAESDIDTPPTATVSISNTSTAGNYEIVVAGGSDNNYDFVYETGILTILEVLSAAGLNEIIVYPNPTADRVSILYEGKKEILVVGIDGRVLLRETASTIDLTTLSNGRYFLLIKDSHGQLIHRTKIIKQN